MDDIETYVDRILADTGLRKCMSDAEIREIREIMVAGLRRSISNRPATCTASGSAGIPRSTRR
jgi:hypothetical protein